LKNLRKAYYDIFSRIYDYFVKLHSSDKSGKLRSWLIEKAGLKPGTKVLDLCTGTGEVALRAYKKIEDGIVVGIDFSEGMLKKAKEKSSDIVWIKADAVFLPFRENCFDVVFCAYAFYELKDREKIQMLKEVKRVLTDRGRLIIMEHEEPKNPFLRFLYRIRLATMGSWNSRKFIENELKILCSIFEKVKKEISPSGNSKIFICSL